MTHTVGISDMRVSTSANDVLVTYSLGSCVGLTLYDASAKVGGMIHCMLPSSEIDEERARTLPQMFVDTGVPTLLQAMREAGANSSRMVAKAAGAAQLLGNNAIYQIGARNYVVLRRLLWTNDIALAAEDTGGTAPRSLALHMDGGRTVVKTGGREKEL